jgi:hypothetical protein
MAPPLPGTCSLSLEVACITSALCQAWGNGIGKSTTTVSGGNGAGSGKKGAGDELVITVSPGTKIRGVVLSVGT